MDLGLMSFLLIITVLGLILLGLPVAFCLMSSSLIFTIFFWGFDKLSILVTSTYGNMVNPTYLAIPLFVLMANVLQFSGLTDDLFDSIWKWLGGVSGGLAIASVLAITILCAMTGLGATGIFTVGMIAYPHMMRRGYDKTIAIGPLGPASALGPLIPPSNIMIILGGYASLSIGSLFMGGFIPGFMMSFGFIIYILIRCFRNPRLAPVIPMEERPSFREKLIALKGVALPIILIIMVLGGIWSGVTTAIEGSGIGALGAMICALIKRRLSIANLTPAVVSTLKTNVMVMWLLIGGTCYAAFMSASGMTGYLSNILMDLPLSPFGIVGLFMIILLIMGCVMESVAIIMITVPVMFPIIRALNIDSIWFGVLFTMAIIIGYVTPPFGYNLFFLRAMIPSEISTSVIYRSVFPYVYIMILVILICMLFPQLIVFLPNLMNK